MKSVSVREFKAEFNKIVLEKQEVIVVRRKTPIGIFRPIDEKILSEQREQVGKLLIGLGETSDNKVSEKHDEVIYKR